MSVDTKMPKGYKSTPFLTLPNRWEVVAINDVTKVYDGTHNTPDYVKKGVPFYSVEHVSRNDFSSTKFISEEVFAKENKRVRLEKGDILMTRIGDIGTAKLIDWDVRASFYVSLALIKATPLAIPKFLESFINSNIFQRELDHRIIHLAFPKKINLGEIGKCKIILPPLPEQQKIAEILSTWDLAIEKTQKLIKEIKLRNKGLAQRLLTGKKRLKGFEEEWEDFNLADVAERITRKNTELNDTVITISAQRGFVLQEDFFNKRVASETLSNYYLIHKGEFAYNKSYSNGYPMGAFKRLNNLDKAVVTTLYICFRLKSNVSSDFMEQYFEAGLMVSPLMKIAQEGGRAHGLLNIGLQDFFGLKLSLPQLAEQSAITNLLTKAEQELKLYQQQLATLKEQKKGLMQKLLTGQIRVKIN